MGAQILGTKYAGPSVAALINAMNPVFITLLAVILLKEKLTFSKVFALLTTLAGAYIILGGAKNVGTVIGIAFSLFLYCYGRFPPFLCAVLLSITMP